MTDSPRRILVTISGRVQGVGYRYSCYAKATSLGLQGWVRNLPDGRVEAAFEGAPPDVQAILDWCRLGPPSARVAALEVREANPTGEAGFRIAG